MDGDETRPGAVVLFLHGGRADSPDAVPLWSPAALRMRPFARAVRARTAGRGIVTGRVRYRHRGWNGSRADAAQDASRALDELTRRYGQVPLVLIGHSMGGRAALRVGGRSQVRAVIALAPWCPEGEPADRLGDTPTVLIHSDLDRITDPRLSLDFARRARGAGTPVCRLELAGSDHAMLRRARDWHAVTAGLTAGFLGAGDLPAEVGAALALGPGAMAGLELPVP